MGVQIHSAEAHLDARDWRQAIARGLKGRCPHCGNATRCARPVAAARQKVTTTLTPPTQLRPGAGSK